MSMRITKSKTDQNINGVCGGLVEYYGIDSVIIRFIFVVLLFIHGIGFFIYIILAIIMPKPEKLDQPPKETIQENVQEIGERLKEAGEELGAAFSKKTEEKHSNRAGGFGILLILIGVIFHLKNLNLIRWFENDPLIICIGICSNNEKLNLLWPFILICIGVWFLLKRWR